ncbi:MAG: hypothetical protein A9Z00_03340 [Thermobacillus sp. ZCTH02-B1]|nr:MAG: hypothetical protein A9Z00_03340 [Thermobacillus sp. ZCTH02-B1]
MFRILWIALAAALGLVLVRPDVSGADGGAGGVQPPTGRAFRDLPSLQALAQPAFLHAAYGMKSDAAAASGEEPNASGIPANNRAAARSVADAAFRGHAAGLSKPEHPPHANRPPSMQSAFRQDVLSGPAPSVRRPFPQRPASGQGPESSDPRDSRPVPDTPRIPEPEADQPVVYVVTAYYLNVRAEPDKTSPIRGLLEMGDEVSVVGKTENGWLKLENGLYIHGAYAEPAEPGRTTAKKTGREVVTASAAPSALPEPAVHGPGRPGETPGPEPLSRKVKSPSGLTEQDIAKLLEGTALEGHGLEEAILGIEEEYGINALFTIAVMKLESGNGKSRLAREKNNLFGLNATGGKNSKAYSFETKRDSVYTFGSLIAKRYLAKGYTTIEKVGKKYCPANPKWASLVESIMKRDHRKLKRTAV